MKKFNLLSYLAIFFLCLFISFSCTGNNSYVKTEGVIWNTSYHITYKGDKKFIDSISVVLNQVGKSLSVFDKNSLVSKLNDSISILADKFLIKVYDTSKKINHLSKGLFDPTVSPLVDAWGFGLGHTPTKDTLAIDSILTFIGINKTTRNGDYIIKEDIRTRFNFSAIAKGYGCDAVGEMFERNNITDYMVEIGGEIALHGKSPSGKSWSIGIDAPVEDKQPGESTILILSLTDVGIATSGNYRNYRTQGGTKMAHTISPISGRPFISEILSATVIAPTCMEADAIATACMAGSFQNAQELLKSSGTQGLLILTDTLWITPGFKKFIISESVEP